MSKVIKFSIPVTVFDDYEQIDVSVWQTTKDLRAANPDNDDANGVTKSYTVENVLSTDEEEGDDNTLYVEIHLSAEHLGGGVVSHEATHAALRLFEHSVGTNTYEIDPDREERIAHLVGDIVSKIYTQLHEREILK